MAQPGLVELARIHRGPVVESLHHGVVAVADAEGRLLQAFGDVDWAPTPRSALKPFQAVGLVESGAADALGLSEEYVALACASHAAQPFQVALVGEWLGRMGLTERALVCGPALPRDLSDQKAAWAGGGPRRIFHNCSGKHCGFLSVARHLGAGLDYARWDHPAQVLYRQVLAEYAGLAEGDLQAGGDGCGLPAIALPIAAMARAAARLGQARGSTPARRAAAARVLAAIAAHPDHLSALDSPAARIMRHTRGNVLLKSGAEGYMLAMVRDRGLGIAIKVADGDPASRVKHGVLAHVLGMVGALRAAEAEALVAEVEPEIADSNGQRVGRVEISFAG